MRKMLIVAAVVVAGTGANAQTPDPKPICTRVAAHLDCDVTTRNDRLPNAEQAAAKFERAAQARRANAMQLAEIARQGEPFPANTSEKIRGALSDDIDQWRAEFHVDRKAWRVMRDQWLPDRDTLTPQQWALKWADWFDARDAWIASQGASGR